MTDHSLDRRTFLSKSLCAGAALCGACALSTWPVLASDEKVKEELLDPKKMNFCGYTCPPECKFLEGTLENDIDLKKEAFALWKLEERFGIEFDPETAICHGCKALDKPEGEVVSRCTVRDCAREKKLDCCIECAELKKCDKDLWRRFPAFKAQVIQVRQRYLAQTESG